MPWKLVAGKECWWITLFLMVHGCASDDATPASSGTAQPETIAAPPQVVGNIPREPEPEPEPDPEPDSPPRTILASHVENARDLGGVALGENAKVASGLLFRGPPLSGLTERGCADVSALGIRSVIDLRVESEVSQRPDDACVLSEAQLLAAPLPVPYNVSAADYIAVLDAKDSIVRVFEALGDEARYPIYFHCTWGRDRTGIVAAVVLLALGATSDVIMDDYLVSDETVGAYPMSLRAALEEIAGRGGIEAYLAAVGVSAQQLATLRSRAIEAAP